MLRIPSDFLSPKLRGNVVLLVMNFVVFFFLAELNATSFIGSVR